MPDRFPDQRLAFVTELVRRGHSLNALAERTGIRSDNLRDAVRRGPDEAGQANLRCAFEGSDSRVWLKIIVAKRQRVWFDACMYRHRALGGGNGGSDGA